MTDEFVVAETVRKRRLSCLLLLVPTTVTGDTRARGGNNRKEKTLINGYCIKRRTGELKNG